MKKMYILAAISALICGFLLYSFLGNVKQSAKNPDVERREVLVAAADIPAYADITPNLFVKKALPAEGLHPDSVTDFEQISGKKSASSFSAGEVIISSKFGENVEKYASYNIPDGMRVMTVKVGSDSGLDQYLVKGDMVDVIFTAFATEKKEEKKETDPYAYDEEDEDEEDNYARLADDIMVKKSFTSVILENVEVFTTGSALDGEGVAYATVTLILTPQDCLRLYASENYGSFSFVLRGHNDDSPGNTEFVYAEDIIPGAVTPEYVG